ncbi:hypothetical protein [Bradyrhizobium elkanii]|uniref:hypothetical protein n=1 Tax=Bradyrhizobium elkanii TaxID=29448 RepID=UPI002168C39D|nr:hypothetical protein [Bradyrhizobium elkanii]MCS3519286.1 integrase [Bradyrhizobium elkanii]MCS4066943.1 integrase [Bradyrhizobium elkanii]MCS4082478.1 integrase [Bradyrhizobium elkanii]MCW2127903.1 integrase [Bradyrhizobium elkanii]MCW2174646.1 integrase [Bradyrhizobium elkanii]
MADAPLRIWISKSTSKLLFTRCPRLRIRYCARFRATFATWAEECTDFPDGVREAALAHKYKSETTAAHQRGAKLEKRRALMDDWADFIRLPPEVMQLARSS